MEKLAALIRVLLPRAAVNSFNQNEGLLKCENCWKKNLRMSRAGLIGIMDIGVRSMSWTVDTVHILVRLKWLRVVIIIRLTPVEILFLTKLRKSFWPAALGGGLVKIFSVIDGFMVVARRAFFLVVLFFGCAFSASAQSPLKDDEDVGGLLNAAYYSIGFTGVGGLQSPGQTSLVHMHLKPNHNELFRDAYQRGNVYAKLYVSCWAATFDPQYFSKIRVEILKTHDGVKVSEMRGSVLGLRSISDILNDQSKGDCGRIAVAGVE